MEQHLSKSNWYFFSVFVLCAGLISFGYYLQWYQGVMPCILCIIQRVVFFAIMIIALAAFLHKARGKWHSSYWLIVALLALIGAVVAGRQLFLQLQSNSETTCLPNIGPMGEIIAQHYGNCSEIAWQLFGVSMPGWSLGFYVLIIILSAWRFMK